MRPVSRIHPFMEELEKIWKEEFPDWRFGQLMSNFLDWVINVRHRYIFFLEEPEMIELLHDYVNNWYK